MTDVKSASISAISAVLVAVLGAAGAIGAAYLNVIKPSEKQVQNSEYYKELRQEIEAKERDLARSSSNLSEMRKEILSLQAEIKLLKSINESAPRPKQPPDSNIANPAPSHTQSDITRTELTLKAMQAVQSSDGLTATLLGINSQGAVLTVNGNKRSHMQPGARIDVTSPGMQKTCFVEIMSFSDAYASPLTMRLDHVCSPRKGY